MGRADLVTPHALYAEVLGELRRRERLLARLGPDAADPVDEFLNAALAFERSHPPSLQGFLHWVRQGSSEVKREQEEAGDAVRIMTVHGAKGLQAPVVILPDTVAAGRDKREVRWDRGPDGLPLPLWAPNQDHQPPLYREALERERQARREEENRLLYVALTRAEDRLVVAGWQRRPSKEATWYDLVAQGFPGFRAAGRSPSSPPASARPPPAASRARSRAGSTARRRRRRAPMAATPRPRPGGTASVDAHPRRARDRGAAPLALRPAGRAGARGRAARPGRPGRAPLPPRARRPRPAAAPARPRTA
jgi:ATP-dependent helicase/nuclease subunit A